MLDKERVLKLANTRMPFGKYQGKPLMALPEEYLLWFQHKGFPEGELGQLMALALALKVEGLDRLLDPLQKSQP